MIAAVIVRPHVSGWYCVLLVACIMFYAWRAARG